MTSADVQVDLDTALRTVFSHAERSNGFSIQEVASELPHQKAFLVKNAGSEELLAVLKIDPFTTKSTACSSNSAKDRTLSIISVSMNLDRPAEGEQAMLTQAKLQMLFKLSGHAMNALGAKKYQKGLNLQPDFAEIPSQLKL